MINYKIGHGFDIHPLVTGRKCIIGGVQIPFEKGLQGHSDADVLLHALCDALIGAMGMGDIGQFFPDNDDQYKILIQEFIEKVHSVLQQKKFIIENIDAYNNL